MNYKAITHYLALGLTALVGFAATDAGQAIIKQYPKSTALFALAGFLLTLYHNPRVASVIVLFLALCSPGLAQTPPNVQTFSLSASPISLPGNKQTVVGTITGLTFTPTPNFDLREDNIISNGANFQGFFGGFNYRLPVLSTKLNNASPNLNGTRFQFYITASAGVSRITGPSDTKQHYAFLAGGGVNYDITQSGRWTFGGEVRYAKLPGLNNNTAIVSLGPSFHF